MMLLNYGEIEYVSGGTNGYEFFETFQGYYNKLYLLVETSFSVGGVMSTIMGLSINNKKLAYSGLTLVTGGIIMIGNHLLISAYRWRQKDNNKN